MEDGIVSVCTPERDTSRADWVVKRCRGPLFTVNRWVPAGFDRYIQICPPAWRLPTDVRDFEFSPSERDPWIPCNQVPVRWSEVAAEQGHALDEYTKYSDLVPQIAPKAAQPGDVRGPLEGTPTGVMIDSIGDAVLSYSGEHQECIVAIWSGFGTSEIKALESANVTKMAGMGQQEHFVLSAPLGNVIRKWRSLLPAVPVSESSVASFSPQAIWPTTEDWFYAVPFDWNSTFFGGPTTLTERLLSDHRIESHPTSIGADYRRASCSKYPTA